jgi:drug/metabolite transporter (DMT)-like permease
VSVSRQRIEDWSLLLLCNLIWGSQFVLVKVVEGWMGPLTAVLFPMGIATLLLLPLVKKRLPTGVPRADLRDFILLGIAGQAAAQVGMTWGTQLSLASNAALLNLALPVVTALFSYWFLSERMTGLRWLGLALALAGALYGSGIDWSSLALANRSYALGNLLVFVGVSGSAFYNSYSKGVLERYDPLRVLLYSYYALLAVLAPVTFIAEPGLLVKAGRFPLRVWIALGLLAVLQYAFSMVLFLRVLARLDANQAALSNYLIPFYGLALAAVVLGERLTPAMMISGAVVLASTFLVTVADTRSQRS